MDGVIVNTEPIHELSFKKHFNEIGLNISQEEYETFRGLSTRNLYQNLKQKYELKQKVEELVQQKRNIFNKIFNEDKELDLLPGVRNLIESLYKDNFQLILATSSARVTLTKIFDRFGLFPYFNHIVSGEDFTNSKPDPTIFLEAIKLSGQPKENCIVIEDSTNGIIAAKRAGIFCIGYKSEASGDQDLSFANKIINDFSILNSDNISTICLVN